MSRNVLWKWYPALYIGEAVGSRQEAKILRRLEKGFRRRPSKRKRMLYFFHAAYRNLADGEEAPEWTRREEAAYIITTAQNTADLLDIYPEQSLLQEYYMQQELYIMGIAKGYQDAVETAGRIVLDYEERPQELRPLTLRQYFFRETCQPESVPKG